MKKSLRKYLIVAGMCALVFGGNMSAYANDMNERFRIEPFLSVGGGSEKVDVGQLTSGEMTSISGGGGAGGGITLGYRLSPRLDMDFTLGTETSHLNPAVANATASFSRTFFLASLMYRIPLNDQCDIKVGGGAGLYVPGDLDVDMTGVSGGHHDTVQYKDAIGAHVMVEFEIFAAHGLSVTFGGKYYSVTYKETSGTRDGVPGFFYDSKVENFNGSGFDLTAAIAKYF